MDALFGGPLTRWHAASAGAFLEANAGLQYVFGDVSGSLRTRLGYTQRQIDGLGTAKDCGTAVVDVMAGFMFDAFGAPTTLVFIAVRAPKRRGRGFAAHMPPCAASRCSQAGCCARGHNAAPELCPRAQVLNASGFLAILAAYKGVVQTSYAGMVRQPPRCAALRQQARNPYRPRAVLIWLHARAQVIFTAIGFGGNGAMLLPGLVTTLGNFPEIRGMVTGLMKSVFFLCASLYTEVSQDSSHCRAVCLLAALTSALSQWYLLLGEQAEPFLILLALLPAAAALACIPFLKHLPKRRFSGNSMVAAAATASAEGLATRRAFFAASGLTIFIALYMAITVMLQSERPDTFLPLVPIAFTTMVLLLSLYAALPATNRWLQVCSRARACAAHAADATRRRTRPAHRAPAAPRRRARRCWAPMAAEPARTALQAPCRRLRKGPATAPRPPARPRATTRTTWARLPTARCCRRLCAWTTGASTACMSSTWRLD
jgi:hypothetical protein